MTMVPVPVQLPEWITDLLTRVAGPAADEIGLTLRDSVRRFRLKRQLRFWTSFKAICEEAGIQPKAVKVSLLFDILERATLEEDDTLQDLWANLLANAADSRDQVLVRTIFPDILRHISKEEAVYLEEMFEIIEKATAYTHRVFAERDGGVPPKLDPISYDNLSRLGLISENEETVPVRDRKEPNSVPGPRYEFLSQELYMITPLGRAFIMACRPPKG